MAFSVYRFVLVLIMFMGLFLNAAIGFCFPEEFVDASGTSVVIKTPPSHVVSLVPTITEIIFSIGAGDAVEAITYHSTYPSETADDSARSDLPFLSPQGNKRTIRWEMPSGYP